MNDQAQRHHRNYESHIRVFYGLGQRPDRFDSWWSVSRSKLVGLVCCVWIGLFFGLFGPWSGTVTAQTLTPTSTPVAPSPTCAGRVLLTVSSDGSGNFGTTATITNGLSVSLMLGTTTGNSQLGAWYETATQQSFLGRYIPFWPASNVATVSWYAADPALNIAGTNYTIIVCPRPAPTATPTATATATVDPALPTATPTIDPAQPTATPTATNTATVDPAQPTATPTIDPAQPTTTPTATSSPTVAPTVRSGAIFDSLADAGDGLINAGMSPAGGLAIAAMLIAVVGRVIRRIIRERSQWPD